MTTYDLYLESGPQRKKTMVHVGSLLGCVANGPTTEAALEATPDAIRAYLRFLKRHGERVDPQAPFETRVAEHLTEGGFLGQGSPYIVFAPDREPVTEAEIETSIGRFHGLAEEWTAWLATQGDAALDAKPVAGRTARAIALHAIGPTGGYLSAALGGAKGFSSIHGRAERGQIPLAEAFRLTDELVAETLRATTPEQRSGTRRRPSGEERTLRKAIRRMLEHPWEHLAELSRRDGGPRL